MSKTRTLIRKIKLIRPLYLQLMFTALAFLTMVVLSYLFMSTIVQNYLVHNTENILAIVQLKIESVLQEAESTTVSFSQTVRRMVLRGDDMDALQEYVTEITEHLMTSSNRESGLDNVYIYLETLEGGYAYINNKRWVPPADYQPRSRPWYKAAVAASGGVAITSPYVHMMTDKLVSTFARSIYDDDGRRLGVVCLDVPIDFVGNEVVATALAQGGYGMLLDHDLIFLAHPSQDFVGKNLRDPTVPSAIFADDVQRGVEISESPVLSFRGEDSIAFFRKLPNGWHLGLVTPKGPYYQSAANMALTLCVLGMALAVALMYVLIRIDAAKTKSDEESRQKSAFLANMSHEMRTPLNAVIGLSQLILEDEELRGENYSKLEKVYNAGMTLLSTVNDILDISKIEAGKFELVPVSYDIPSIINDAVAQSILHVGEKPVQFILNIDENLPACLYGDEFRIKQVLNNLLSNAFKYTKEGTVELGINCVQEGDTVWLTVRVQDTGIGIRPEHIDHLFDDYSQIDLLTNRRIMGTGLGLPITKRLLELLNGSITVESEYGKGSVFTVRLPQKFVTDTVIGPETVESLKSFNYSDKKRQRDSKLTRLSLPYARVLVVDDVATNLDVAKGLMKPYNMQIDCVSSGQEAIDAIRDKTVSYSAVFMDHMMPVMDGIEATRRIREIGTDYAKAVPIIALTANAIAGNEEMFLNKGFQAFIPKPIEIIRLDAVIRKWVRDKEQERLYFEQQKKLNAQRLPDDQSVLEKHYASGRRSGIDWRALDAGVAGLDTEKGIERFGGDKDSYFKVLRSYSINTPPLLEAVKGVSKDNLADYAIVVHGIKGSSRGVCANTFADVAETLEKAARAGDYDFVAAHNTAFLGAAWKLLSEIDEMLLRIWNDNPKPKMGKPDKETLFRLLETCRNYDMDGVDTALAEIERYEYEHDDGLVAWLRENVEQMNFPQVIEKLSALNK